MPFLAPILAVFGRYLVGFFIVRVVTALGISLISFASINTVGDQLEAYVTQNVGGLASQFSTLANALGLLDAISIVMSAYIGAIVVKQIMGAFNKITFGAVGD